MKCAEKRRFIDRDSAKKSRNSNALKFHSKYKIYTCPECGFFHLATKNKGNK